MTDKERLEEAKLMAEMLRVETRLPHDFPFDLVDWLVEQSERVQELEEEVERYQSGRNVAVITKMKMDVTQERNERLEKRVQKLEKENQRYSELLNKIRELCDIERPGHVKVNKIKLLLDAELYINEGDR